MKTALIDADIVAYKCAAAAQETSIDWGDGVVSLGDVDVDGACNAAACMVEQLQTAVWADEVVLALSDPDDAANFRRRLCPTYKANRDPAARPAALQAVKDFLADTFPTYVRPGLEGDDVLGILMTSALLVPGDKVCVSEDKDMRTIPGDHFVIRNEQFLSISQAEADRFHLYQTLIGDATDHYPGCPGVGPWRAERLLDNPRLPLMTFRTVTKGRRKGERETKWDFGDDCDVWTAIVGEFLKAGLDEGDALLQARLARILRKQDYDFKRKEPILWNPPKT